MEKVGLFFGSLSGNTRLIAELISEKLPDNSVDMYDIFEENHHFIKNYNNIIFGIPTWGQLHLNDDWQLFLDYIREIDLSDKKVAIYGLGDQQMFRNAFVDAMGIVYDVLHENGCKFIGYWPVEGYEFDNSFALRNEQFCGLVIDEDNQCELTDNRVSNWVRKLENNFH